MQRFDQINMIPFIDIVLVLLAIVLTTATFVSQGLIDVSLPESESEPAAQSPGEAIEIAIDQNNQLFYKGEKITLDDLRTQLAALPKTTELYFRVDKVAQFEQFFQVVDYLKQQKLNKVFIQADIKR